MSSTIHASDSAILYFIRPYIAFIMLSMSSFYHAVVSSAIPQACLPATVVALCFFPSRREIFTTGKGLLVLLDQLKLIVSNFSSLLMASLP